MSNFDTMGKAELRAACKAAGIAYGKLNNDGMRAALKAQEAPKAQKTEVKTQPAPAAQKTEKATSPTAGTIVEATVQRVDSLQIQKDRPERNGVRRQSAGSIGDQLWTIYSNMQKALGDAKLAHKDAKAAAVERGFNPNSASIAFFQWVKFNEGSDEGDEGEE